MSALACAVRHQPQDRVLARRQLRRSPRWRRAPARRRAGPRKSLNALAESLPGRLGLDEDVIAALQRHEVRAGNFRGEQPALLERNARIAARVHHHRRHSHLRQQRTHVDLAERFENARGDLRLRRRAHQVAEPAHLLGVRVRNEQRREQLAERRILLAPALADQLDQRLAVAARLRRRAAPSLRRSSRTARAASRAPDGARRIRCRPRRPAKCRAAESGRGPRHR